jgi:hypothetical protein
MTANLLEKKVASLSLKQTNYKLIMVQPSGDMSAILEIMKSAVWALFFRKIITNQKPQHGVFPSGGDSWCKFKNSASPGVAHEHKHSLPATGMDAIKLVFRDLADVYPLKKCFRGKTHNHNERVHAIVWRRISKTVFVRLDTLKFGVCDAVLCFNLLKPSGNFTYDQV